MTFENVSADIVRALNEIGIIKPTLIQEKSIPLIQAGKDLIGMSRTGSGKTAAFGIPLLEKVEHKKGPQILIIGPTRELAVQIAKEIDKFGKYMNVNVATIFGGVAINPQIDRIKVSEIIVGTPGRLLDHLERRTLDLSKIKTVVLDEADKMVEMGFVEDIQRILNKAPKDRQILLFGATLSNDVDTIRKQYMRDPVTVEAEKQVKDDLLEQFYFEIPKNKKFSLLVHLLNKEDMKSAIIFCSARSTVEMVAKNLRTQKISVDMLHGKLSQNRRLNVIEKFNKGYPKVLVASAVAARGLHIDSVTHVFNYDLSQDPQEYIHRIGRTARAGKSGKAITLLSDRDYDAFNEIQDRFHVDIKKLPLETFTRVNFNANVIARRGNGRSGGYRGGSRDGSGYSGGSSGFGLRRNPNFNK